MKTKMKKTLKSLLGLSAFTPSLFAGAPTDSVEIGKTVLDSIQNELYESQLDTNIKTQSQIDSLYLEMNKGTGEIKVIPKETEGAGPDPEKEVERIDPETTNTDSIPNNNLPDESPSLEDNYDSNNGEQEKVEASGDFSNVVANGLEKAAREKILSNENPVTIPGDTTYLPDVEIPGREIQLDDVTIPGDTTWNKDVVIPGREIQLDDVTIPGDTTWASDVTIPGKQIQLPDVEVAGDTIQAPTVVLRDTLIHKNTQPSKKLSQPMPVDSTVVDTIFVDKQKTMLQNMTDYIADVKEKYFGGDVKISKKIDKNVKGLEKSLGASKTFTDDNYTGVRSNLDSLGNNLAEILMSTNMPAGTAVADQVNNTVKYLQNVELQYTDYLEQAEVGLRNFEKQAKKAGTLSKDLQTKIDNQRANAQERISRIDSTLIEVKGLIRQGKQVKKAKGIGDKEHEFKYSGDEDSQKVVEFFQNQYNTTKDSLSPELFQSWENDFYNPQLKQVIDLYEDVLNKRFVKASRLEKINEQSDGLLDTTLIHSISEERENLQNSLEDLKAIKNGQKKSKAKFKMPKIKFPKWGKKDVSVSAGGSFGGLQSLRMGVEYGPLGLNIEGGLSPYDRTILDSTTTPNFLGTHSELSNKDKDFKYLGVSGEAHLGPVFLGAGANYWMYNKQIIEDIYKGNEIILPDRNTSSKSEISSNIFGGVRAPISNNASADLSFGYDSQKGGYLGFDLVKHFGDNRGNKGSKKKK